jgi:gentisate 1,2-dioxygenase
MIPSEFSAASSIDRLYELLGSAGMNPGWNKPEPSLWASPKKSFIPAHWSYEIAKAALDSAGRFVSTELAERRNLILYNPIPGNTYATVRTLIAAYQMVMPNETARSHRHSPNALRLVLDAAPGNYTIVDGKKLPMLPGDVLLTPNWSWHGHQNESAACGYWIDVLDAPLVHLLEPMFFEQLPEGGIERGEVDERSPMRFAFSDIMKKLKDADRIELGPSKLDTMALEVWKLEPGQAVKKSKTTGNSVFAVMEGEGVSVVDGAEFRWKRGDVMAVPAWRDYSHESTRKSYLLRATDEPLLKRLNWLR